jgi:hypothetical protein
MYIYICEFFNAQRKKLCSGYDRVSEYGPFFRSTPFWPLEKKSIWISNIFDRLGKKIQKSRRFKEPQVIEMAFGFF